MTSLKHVIALLGALTSVLAAPTTTSTDLLMPDVQPKTPDTYLCRSMDVSEIQPFITEFIPNANMEIAHHILLYGCETPGSQDPVWNCGEMAGSVSDYKAGPVCASGSKIIYAWAMDAPSLKLPPDVAFHVGGDSGIKWLTVQVHYKNVSTFLPPKNNKDSSGLTIVTTNQPKSRSAGVYLLNTGGAIPKHSIEYLEAACPFPDASLEIHPFAFRTHAHSLGRVISGYRIRDGQWTEIGRQDPRLPEMFYNVTTKGITVKHGDILAARCTMENNLDHDVYVGATQADEMCNFYIMYFVDGHRTLSNDMCYHSGAPQWYLDDYEDQRALNLTAMPDTASVIPATGRRLVANTRELEEVQPDDDSDEEERGVEEEEDEDDESPEESEFVDRVLAGMDPEEVEELVASLMQPAPAPRHGVRGLPRRGDPLYGAYSYYQDN